MQYLKSFRGFLAAWIVQSLIALDNFCNAFILPLLTWSVGMSGESMSAHCYRDAVKGRFWAVRLMPIIDWMFKWQKPDPNFTDAAGAMILAHCRRSFAKEKARFYLPPEYRDATFT